MAGVDREALYGSAALMGTKPPGWGNWHHQIPLAGYEVLEVFFVCKTAGSIECTSRAMVTTGCSCRAGRDLAYPQDPDFFLLFSFF